VEQKLSVDLVLEEKKPKWLFKQASKKKIRRKKYKGKKYKENKSRKKILDVYLVSLSRHMPCALERKKREK
jgi:hypothetical protein